MSIGIAVYLTVIMGIAALMSGVTATFVTVEPSPAEVALLPASADTLRQIAKFMIGASVILCLANIFGIVLVWSLVTGS